MKGECLCGAVKIEVDAPVGEISVCHCGMCRRWTGAAMAVFEAPAGAVAVTGPVKTFASSPFAERAWCDACGAHLWIRDHDGPYEFMPGLFDAAEATPLTREIYVDRAMASMRFAGDHVRATRAAYEAENRFVEGGR